jgi:hypothetical protein
MHIRVRGVPFAAAPSCALGTKRIRGLGASAPPDQLHVVSNCNLAAFDNEAIERELAFEAPVDIACDVLVLNQRVWIKPAQKRSDAL